MGQRLVTQSDWQLFAELAVAAGTLALAAFTGWLAHGTSILAREAHSSSSAADRLYNLQREEIERKESAAKPNLQIVDVRQANDRRASSVSDNALWIDLSNFGLRPARILGVKLTVPGMPDKVAEQRTRPVLHRGETLRVEVERAFNLGVTAALTRTDDLLNKAEHGQVLVGEVEAAEPDFAGTLAVRYGEVDGSGECQVKFQCNLMDYRPVFARTDLTYGVLEGPTSKT